MATSVIIPYTWFNGLNSLSFISGFWGVPSKIRGWDWSMVMGWWFVRGLHYRRLPNIYWIIVHELGIPFWTSHLLMTLSLVCSTRTQSQISSRRLNHCTSLAKRFSMLFWWQAGLQPPIKRGWKIHHYRWLSNLWPTGGTVSNHPFPDLPGPWGWLTNVTSPMWLRNGPAKALFYAHDISRPVRNYHNLETVP